MGERERERERAREKKRKREREKQDLLHTGARGPTHTELEGLDAR